MANPNFHNLRLPRLMGVLNVTPDSFSDGGKFNSVETALDHATSLIASGATVIDVGGESTRPGATRLTAAEEQARVLPVILALTSLPQVASGAVAISIDTLNASTARLAIEAGATIVNDVSGGQADPEMFAAVAATSIATAPAAHPAIASAHPALAPASLPLTYVLGHWANFEAGAGAVQQTDDIVASVKQELAAAVQLAEAAGLKRGQIVIDPGLGFGKDSSQNWSLVEAFAELASIGLPVLIGASRKRFIAAEVVAQQGIELADVTVEQRDAATAALSSKIFNQAVESKTVDQLWGFRVHNVTPNLESLQAAAALRFAHIANDLQS